MFSERRKVEATVYTAEIREADIKLSLEEELEAGDQITILIHGPQWSKR